MKIMGLLGLCWVMAVSTFAGTGEGSLSASVDTQDYTLTVVSEVGSPFPGVGTHVYAWGASVGLLSSGSRLAEGSNAVFECSGWTGGGLVPSLGNQGKLNGFTFEGTTESTLTWNWELSDDILVKSVSSDLVDAGSHVMFLEGVPVSQTFHAEVDWNGKTPGQIRFVREHTLLQYSSSPDYTANLAEFAEGERLHVYAMSADREFSEKVFVNFSVIPRPLGLGVGSFEAYSDGGLKYLVSPIPQISMNEGLDHLSADGDKLPFFAGNPFSLNGGMSVCYVVDGSGTGRANNMDLTGFGLKVGALELVKKRGPGRPRKNALPNKKIGFEVSPRLDQEITFRHTSSGWNYGGFVSYGLGFDVALEIPLVHPVAEALLDVELGVVGSVDYKGNVVGLKSPGVLTYQGSFPLEIGGKALLFLGDDDVFGAGVWAALLGTMELDFNEEHVFRELGCRAEIGTKVVLGVYVGENTIWDNHWVFYEAEPHEALSDFAEPMGFVPPENADSDEFALLPRTEVSKAALPLGDEFFAPLSISDPSPVFPQSNVFQYVQTAFDASVSNGCYLWNVDDAARSSENRTVLKFSFDDGAAWSSPATVWEDGTGDYNPSVQVLDDGSAFAVWANGKSALPEGAGVSNMLEELEIGFGKYSPGSGWSCTNLTDNAVLDQSPRISVAADGSAWVVWVRNAANHYKGGTNEPNTLMARHFDGVSWGAEQWVATNLNLMASGGLVRDGNETIYTCSMHDDDNYFSVDDTEIYQAVCSNGVWGGLIRLTDNSVRDGSVQLKATSDGSLVAAWVQGEELRLSRRSDFSESQVVMSTTNEPMAAYFDLLCGASNQIGMVWCSASGAGSDAFMVNYDPVLSMWSDPIQLTADALAERAFKGNYDGTDGTLNLAFVRSEILNPTNGAPQYGITDVCLMDFNSGVDLRVVDFTYDSALMVPGSNVVLSAVVDNAGLSGATNVVLAIYDGDPASGGVLIGETNVSLFAAGAIVSFDQAWQVPANDSYCAYSNSVTVDFYRPDGSGEMIHRLIQDVVIPTGSKLLVSTDWIDSGLFTNPTETLSALLYCGAGTSVVSAILTRFETPVDSDLDFVSDAEELRFGTDPNLLDTDGDGLDDRFELLQFESSAILADTDGDGYDDYHEYVAGTSSTNANSLFTIDLQGGLLSVPTMTNRTYAVEYTDTLGDEWQSLTNFSGTGGTIDVQHGSETNSRFYRVNVQFE